MNVNQELAHYYKTNCGEGTTPRWTNITGDGQENCINAEMKISDDLVTTASEKSDVAVVVIGRYTREGRDLSSNLGGGDWDHFKLTNDSTTLDHTDNEMGEIELLTLVCSHFTNVVVVLNTTTVIDMSEFYEPSLQPDPEAWSHIKGIVYGWAGGNETGRAIADILSGDVNPSGKLVDTITKHGMSDYPLDWEFGNTGGGDDGGNTYNEDIYEGYRFFETFEPDKILYHFGYGLSYTTFDMSCESFKFNNNTINVSVKVKNTGKVKGKQVVQIYFKAPSAILNKPSHELIAYGKTSELKPQEAQTLNFNFDIKQMASYNDYDSNSLEKNAWVLENGDYHILYGTSANINDLHEAGIFNLSSNVVVEKESQLLTPRIPFERHDDSSDYDNLNETPTPKTDAQLKSEVQQHINTLSEISQTGDIGLKLKDVYKDQDKLKKFIGQINNDNLANIVATNWDKNGLASIPGTSSMTGGVNQTLRNMGIPVVRFVEGTAGIKSGPFKSTQIPINIQLACTFNNDLVNNLCYELAKEMKNELAPVILAPGVNVHRDPRCGRNFEYFSEDPLLSGMMAASKIKGWQNGQIACVIKHFAANNQENDRYNIDEKISERALREIHLKPFEIAIKQSHPYALMTSYNSINGRYSTENFELKQELLRDEWNYQGLVMTDWGSKGSTTEHPEYKNTDESFATQLGALIRAGGDEAQNCNLSGDDIIALENLKTDLNNEVITIKETQQCVINILNFITKTFAFRDKYNLPKYDYKNEIKNIAPIFSV